MSAKCGRTGCPNPAERRCEKCGIYYCPEHLIASESEPGVVRCPECDHYVRSLTSGEVAGERQAPR